MANQEKENTQTEEKNQDNQNEEEYEEEHHDDGDEDADNNEECDEKDESKKEEDDSKENEELDIDELLKRKIKLDDGSEHFMFSRGPKYSDESWPVNCHLCRMGNLITEDQIKNHIRGRRHYLRLEQRKPSVKQMTEPFFQVAPKDAKNDMDKQIKIYPGEVIGEITEEYADRVIKPEEFQTKPPSDPELIKKLSKEPIHDYNEKLPVIGLCYLYKMHGFKGLTYYCTLCSTRMVGSSLRHVLGEPHQMKYIKRHFPKLSDKVVDRLTSARGVDVRESVRNIFRKLYRKIENAKGFRKISIVDDDDFFKNLKKYTLKTRFDTHYDESTIPITDHEVDVLIRKCINGMEFIKPDRIPGRSDDRGRRDDFDRYQDRGRSPLKRRYDDYDDLEWRRYHEIIRREIQDLNADYQEYDRYASSHPRYDTEENIYFKSRVRQGHKKEDIRRDWHRIWRQRLRDMYEKDLEERKYKVKRMLRLPANIRTPSPSPPRMMRPSIDAYNRGMYGDRSAGPRDMDMLQPVAPQSFSRPLGVISSLRLLTALEEQLGSLGPKAVQLLSRAVLTEKTGKNPNDLMMENEYYIFFVTAKEKLQGQLFANILDVTKTAAVNRACEDITTLLEMFEDYMKRQGKSIPTMSGSGFDDRMKSVGDGGNRFPNMTNQYSSTNNGGNNFGGGGSSNFAAGRSTGGGGNFADNTGRGNAAANFGNFNKPSNTDLVESAGKDQQQSFVDDDDMGGNFSGRRSGGFGGRGEGNFGSGRNEGNQGNFSGRNDRNFGGGRNEGNFGSGRNEGNFAGGRGEGNFAGGRNDGNFAGGRNEGNFGSGRNEGNFGAGRGEGNFGGARNEGNFGGGRNEDNFGGGRNEGNFGGRGEANFGAGRNEGNFGSGRNEGNFGSGRNEGNFGAGRGEGNYRSGNSGSFSNNYSSGSGSGGGGLNNYSSVGSSGGGSGNQYRTGGNSGGSGGIWQSGGNTSSSQIAPPIVSYPERSNRMSGLNMNKW